jgi:hypothetical protein
MRRTLRGLMSAPTEPFSEYAPTVGTIKPGFAEPPGDSKANALQHLIPATCQPSSLLELPATPPGSLTPADAPLIDAEILLRQSGPAQLAGGQRF